eukprot:10438551-Heterocapsa_arctica.AAC.1
MSSVRLREPDRYSSLPEMFASDAQWIVELHKHQEICQYDNDLPAVVYKSQSISLPTHCIRTSTLTPLLLRGRLSVG